MDTTKIGWAVQRTGAGREKAGQPVDPHAGIGFHARRGARVEAGEPVATIYATSAEMLDEPIALLRKAVTIAEAPPAAVELVSRVITRETAEAFIASPPKT
jgi:pyrimidine-nucleoside phosphorylase